MRICLTALFVLGTYFGIAAVASCDDTIKIGVSSPLTGEAATYGLDIRDFLEFANQRFGDGRYELLFEDDRCSGKDAVSVAHKFISVEKVRYAIGFGCSGAALAAAPLYEKAKVPTLVTFASSPRIADAGDYIFRTYPSDAAAGALLAKQVSGSHSSIAIISELTDYAQDLKNAFTAALKDSAQNKQIKIISEDYLPESTDFRTQLLRLKAAKPEAIFINTQAELTFAAILKQMQQIGWEPKKYGAYWPGSPALQKVAGSDLESVVFVDTPSLDRILDKDGQKLYQEYRARGGELRSTEALFASCIEAFRALVQADKSGQDIRSFLYHNQFTGIFGPYHFDIRGEIEGLSLVLKEIKNGRPEELPHSRNVG